MTYEMKMNLMNTRREACGAYGQAIKDKCDIVIRRPLHAAMHMAVKMVCQAGLTDEYSAWERTGFPADWNGGYNRVASNCGLPEHECNKFCCASYHVMCGRFIFK